MEKDTIKIDNEYLKKRCKELRKKVVYQFLENLELEGRIFDLEKEIIRIKKIRTVNYEGPDCDKFKGCSDNQLIDEMEKRGMIEEDPDEEDHTG